MFVPDVEQVRDAFEYTAWADRRSVEVARSVPADGYVFEQDISLGSVHKVLVHMLAVQELWLARWKGAPPARMADVTDYPTLAAVEERWPAVHAELTAFVAGQTPASLAGSVSYRNSRGEAFSLPLGELMLHVADHATYHRGQLNSMAKRAGGKPLPIMRVTWALERRAGGGR